MRLAMTSNPLGPVHAAMKNVSPGSASLIRGQEPILPSRNTALQDLSYLRQDIIPDAPVGHIDGNESESHGARLQVWRREDVGAQFVQ